MAADVAPAVATEARFTVESWDLEGPLPAMGGFLPLRGPDALSTRLQIAVSGRDVVVTEGMRCAARELGRVILAGEGRLPGERLKRFILGACGNPSTNAAFQSIRGEVPADQSLEAILEEWGSDIDKMWGAAPRRTAAGAALARKGDQVVVVLTFINRYLDVEPFALAPSADGTIDIKGTVLGPTEMVQGMVNQGLHGFARCAFRGDVRAPKFAASCPVAPDDETAWIGMSAFKPKRWVGTSILSVLARPAGRDPLQYRPHAYTERGPRKAEPHAFAVDFVSRLNRVRKAAGSKPLDLEVDQSATAALLAGHLAHAQHERDDEKVEEVMLGMLAGWDVETPVVNGSVAWTLSHQAQDIGDIMGSALDWPTTRAALLDPEYDLLAVGPLAAGDDELLLFLGSWDRFDGHSVEADTKAAWESLHAARKGRKVAGVMPEIDPKSLKIAAGIDEGGSAEKAMEQLLQAAVDQYQNSMYAWTIYPRSLDDIVWPEELVATEEVFVSLAVAVERHPDIAWSREVILVVAHIKEPSLFARSPAADVPAEEETKETRSRRPQIAQRE